MRGGPSGADAHTANDAATLTLNVANAASAHAEGWVVPCWRACLAHISAGLRSEAVSRWCWHALARDVCRGGIMSWPGGTRCVPGRLYLGDWSPLCTGAGPDGSLGEGVDDDGCRMFLRVLYSFDGGAGACPGCGEVATVTAGPVAAGTEHGQQRQPGPAVNGHRRGGQAAAWREWAGAGPRSLAGVAIGWVTPGGPGLARRTGRSRCPRP
jgi:hypothetical protein